MLIISFVLLAIEISPKTEIQNSSLLTMDESLFVKINQTHIPSLNQLMILLTRYGREVVWTLVCIALFFKGGEAGRKTAIIMAITVLVLIPLGIFSKELIARPRPVVSDNDLVAADSDFAFPSGHALITAACAAVLLGMFRNTRRQALFSIVLATEAALVCFSRIYVGGHYPLDVIGGILLGTSVTMFFIASEEQLDKILRRIYKVIAKQ